NSGQDWSLRPGGASVNPAPPLTTERGRPQPMKFVHGVARRAAITALGLSLAIPVTGFTATAWAKSDTAAATAGKGNSSDKGNSADKGGKSNSNGNSNSKTNENDNNKDNSKATTSDALG